MIRRSDSSSTGKRQGSALRAWLLLAGGTWAVLLGLIGVWKWPHISYWWRTPSERRITLSRLAEDLEAAPTGRQVSTPNVSLVIPEGAVVSLEQSDFVLLCAQYANGKLQVILRQDENPLDQPQRSHEPSEYGRTVRDFERYSRAFTFWMSRDELLDHAAIQVSKAVSLPACEEVILFETSSAKGWIFYNPNGTSSTIEALTSGGVGGVAVFAEGQFFRSRDVLIDIARSIVLHPP